MILVVVMSAAAFIVPASESDAIDPPPLDVDGVEVSILTSSMRIDVGETRTIYIELRNPSGHDRILYIENTEHYNNLDMVIKDHPCFFSGKSAGSDVMTFLSSSQGGYGGYEGRAVDEVHPQQ